MEQAALDETQSTSRISGALLAGVGLASFASLLLELALTRLFSVVLFYHFAFLAISVALLGLGAGGVHAYLNRKSLLLRDLRTVGATVTAINALAIVAVLELILHVPVSLNLEWENCGRLTAMYIAAGVPFFLTGVLLSLVFARASLHSPRLYGADLVGGALACVAVVPLLDFVGGPNCVILAALAMAVASIVWSSSRCWRATALALACGLVILVIANHSGRLIDIVFAKGQRRTQSWMLFSKWNAISRVEIDEVDKAKYIVIDADASTAIMNVDPRNWDDTAAPAEGADKVGGPGASAQSYRWKQELMSAAPAIVNVLRPHGSYAIIGPGGGVDVLRAVANGSTNVDGIEINPIIANTIMRGQYADYAFHLYELPQVHIHVADGRSWLRSRHEMYDVVQMTLVDTWASTAAGAFALSENNLYTLEAFREFFDHLKPEGMLAITRWEFKEPREALRIVSQELRTLKERGTGEPRSYFIVVSDGGLDEDGRPVTVLAKKSPFTEQELAVVRAHLAHNKNLELLYSPDMSSTILDGRDPPLQAIAEAMPVDERAFETLIDPPSYVDDGVRSVAARWSARDRMVSSYPYDVSPVSDNAPFFFFTFKIRHVLHHLLTGAAVGMDWKNNLGVLILGMVLVLSLMAVLVFLIAPLVLHGEARRQHVTPLLYFIAIGMGYIMVEISMIQRFVLFLGHPSYALTVVVFLMLLASSAGSVISRRWLHAAQDVSLLLEMIVAGAVLYIFILPPALTGLVGLLFPAKVIISGVFLVPLAFFMGMPFPTGLRALSPSLSSHSGDRSQVMSVFISQREARSSPEPGNNQQSPPFQPAATECAWAMNASSSVLGSVLATVVAIHFGLNVALGCAAAAYAVAAVVTRCWRPSPGY